MAGVVPVSRHLVWRTVSQFRTRLRNRLVGRGWLGMGRLGIRLANHYAVFNRGRYYSGSRTFYNRGGFDRGREARGRGFDRAGGGARPFDGNRQAARGYAAPRGESGVRSGAFSGYNHGGETRS